MKRSFIITTAFLILGLFVTSNALAEEIDCLMCHADKSKGKSLHAAVSMGCNNCHSGIDASEMPHKITGATKGLLTEGAELCFYCHDKKKFTGKEVVHMPVAGGMCSSCHDPHASDFDKLILSEKVCFNCHDSTDVSSKEYVHSPVAGGLCSACHNPHQSENKKLLLEEQPNVCFTCHDKTRFYAPVVHSPVTMGMCTICHDPHQSDNEKLTTLGRENLCYGCHDRTSFTRKGSSHKPVKEGKCLICHRSHAGPNESLVYRKGNILCRKCHAEIEKNPHVVSGFQTEGHPIRSRRDPNRPGKIFSCQSCHVSHSSDSPYLFRFKAKSAFDLCKYCHDF